MNYKVLAISITGKHGKTYLQGDMITSDQIHEGHEQALIEQKAIEPVEPPKPPKPKKDETV